ncbi:hypothetical protein OKW23_001062 [Bacilli bacterium PM5-9]|nr:hypothetical protein [Bacilli bacterium PM5-9]
MKKVMLMICAFFMISIQVNAIEKYDQEWTKNYGGSAEESFKAVLETHDGGLLALGNSGSTDAGFNAKGYGDGIVTKIDKDGNIQWIKNYGGSDYDQLSKIIKTNDNKYLLVGMSWSADNGISNKGEADAIAIKIDENGSQEWIKNYGGSSGDLFNDAVATTDGYILVGNLQSKDAGVTFSGTSAGFAIKIDENGNQQWIKAYGGNKGNGFDGVIKSNDGKYIAVGYTSSISGDVTTFGDNDMMAVKFDDLGTQEWIKNYGGSKSENAYGIVTTGSDYLIVGYGSSNDNGFTCLGDTDIYLVKVDENGNQILVNNYGGSSTELVNGIIKGDDNNFLIYGSGFSNDAGYESPDGFNGIVIEVDKDGVQQNIKSYRYINHLHGLIKLSNGMYYGVGYSSDSENYPTLGNDDAMLIRLNIKTEVKYDVNGGKGNTPSSYKGFPDTKYTIEFTPAPSKNGYTFLGWSDGTNTYLADGSTNNELTLAKNDITLKAVYKKNAVDVIDDDKEEDEDIPDTGYDNSNLIISLFLTMSVIGGASILKVRKEF